MSFHSSPVGICRIGIVLTDNAKARASSISTDRCQLMRKQTPLNYLPPMDIPASRERVEGTKKCGSCSIDISRLQESAPPEDRVVDYQIGRNVWRRTGGTNNEALEKIDFAPALKTAGRLKDDSRLSSGTLATD